MSRNSAASLSFSDFLRQTFPPTSLVHVGAGMGVGEMHKWRQWQVPRAWIIDADADQLVWAEQLVPANPGWTVCAATLAEADGNVDFFHASNPSESGVVPVDKLNAIWPTLRLIEQSVRSTTRLDTIIGMQVEQDSNVGLWLIVDVLPALRVLQGGEAALERCSVVWLRALLQNLPEAVAGCTLAEVEQFLNPRGFRCVHIAEANHPSLGDAYFVRDWPQWLQPRLTDASNKIAVLEVQNTTLSVRHAALETELALLGKARDEQAAARTELQTTMDLLRSQKTELEREKAVSAQRHTAMQDEIAALRTASNEQTKLATERQAQLDALNEEKVALASTKSVLEKETATLSERLTALQGEVTVLSKVREEQTKLVTELQGQIEKAGKEKAALDIARDELAKTAAERQNQLNAMTAEKKELKEANSSLMAERNASAQQLAKLQGEVTALTAARSEQAKLASDLQEQQKHQSQALDEQNQIAGQSEVTIAALEAEKKVFAATQTKLETERNTANGEVATLVKARDNLSAENKTLKASLHAKEADLLKVEADRVEFGHRERQLMEEIVRAEAQIDLIKDLLLREPGL